MKKATKLIPVAGIVITATIVTLVFTVILVRIVIIVAYVKLVSVVTIVTTVAIATYVIHVNIVNLAKDAMVVKNLKIFKIVVLSEGIDSKVNQLYNEPNPFVGFLKKNLQQHFNQGLDSLMAKSINIVPSVYNNQKQI